MRYRHLSAAAPPAPVAVGHLLEILASSQWERSGQHLIRPLQGLTHETKQALLDMLGHRLGSTAAEIHPLKTNGLITAIALPVSDGKLSADHAFTAGRIEGFIRTMTESQIMVEQPKVPRQRAKNSRQPLRFLNLHWRTHATRS